MTRVLLCFVVCCCGVVFSAVYHAKQPPKPDKFKDMDGCYVEEIDSVIAYDAQVNPIGRCVGIVCSKKYLHYFTCGVIGVDSPKCYITEEDLRKPYPDCCPTFKCDTNEI